MKKLLFAAMILLVACSNPEDKATGDADSTSFNNNEDNNLNTNPGPTDPGSQSDVTNPDTSAAPAIEKKNTKSETEGTNRGYGKDSAR